MKKSLAKIADTGESTTKSLFNFGLFIFTRPGLGLLKKITKRYLQRSGIITQHQIAYSDWIKAQSEPSLVKNDFEQNVEKLILTPKVSIILSARNANQQDVNKTLASICDQSYAHWELCVSGTLSPTQFTQKDDRIKLLAADNNNAAAYINTLLTASTGDYVLFLMPGDIMTPGCLFEVIKHINAHPANLLIYTDDDRINNNGTYSTPYFKPDWSPDTLLSRNYIGHNYIAKKELTHAINGISEETDTDYVYDFLLRASEATDRIGHIAKILFHCASHLITGTENTTSKKALNDAMTRRGTPASIDEITGAPGCYYVDYEIKQPASVSIIIPTKDNAVLLKTTIDSILEKTNYPDYEIIVLDNNSKSEEFFGLIKKYQNRHPDNFRCINANFPFNFARLMNLGVAESRGAYILMCNNDVEVIHTDWITKMVSYAQHAKIGAVGVKLLYPDNTIQHAGIVMGNDEASSHIYANHPAGDNGYFYGLKAVTNYAAVTAACMMCRTEVYHKAGGMDEALEVEYNDIDFCLRLLQNGHYNLYLPSAVLYHHESATRGHPFRSIKAYKQHEKDLAIFKSKWQPLIDNDPFYNPNLRIPFA